MKPKAKATPLSVQEIAQPPRSPLAKTSSVWREAAAASAIIAEARLKVPVPPATRSDGRRRPARLSAPTWVPHSEIAEAYNSYHQQMRVNRKAAQDFLVQPLTAPQL
jgi:hypothetical protein